MILVGILIGIVITLLVISILARRYYLKNFNISSSTLKDIFKEDLNFDFKDADFED